MQPLPVDSFLDEITDHARASRAVVVVAPPGAGKTTRVPAALAADGPVILLQPRRVAARSVAQRIAGERGWTIGREIGWQIRFDKRFGPIGDVTRLLVATEGILTARLQQDPLLSDFRTIVLDEFHERSIYADLSLALARQAWCARDDLRIVVMSATLDAEPVAAFLGGCPIVRVPGRQHPIDVSYAPQMSVADAAVDLLGAASGDVLCFLPGAQEIRRAIAEIESKTKSRDIAVVPLYGALDAAEQDAALKPGSRRRIIVATNIAETSVTVPGVTAVVDSGLQKVARYDAERAIDSLELERITMDSADQRAGRAGREAPGVVRRLWDSRDRLRPHREPEIHRVDLSATALDIVAWGGDPRTFEWFEAPRADAIEAAMALLARIGAVKDGRLTKIGEQVQRLPLHPRLARMLVAAGGARAMAQACALLSERHFLAPRKESTTSDLLSAVDDWRNVPPHIQRVAREIEDVAAHGSVVSDFSRTVAGRDKLGPYADGEFRRAVFAGYPDRVAQRRDPSSPRVRLSTGAGATLTADSGVRDFEFVVALDVQQSNRPNDPDARVRVASRVEREWLEPTSTEVVHRFDRASGTVKAAAIDRYDALVLAERPVQPDPSERARLLADAWMARGPADEDQQLLRRLRFAGGDMNLEETIAGAALAARSLADLTLASALPSSVMRTLDRDAPLTLAVPSGRSVPLKYEEDGSVSASVKLQELFGLPETPRIGPRREPVLLALLAPNGRPVQLTRDLKSFWDRTYPEVRKELRGRYPKHPWPDDPWSAKPTARTKRRSG